MLEQLCRLADLLFGQTGIAEHECCSRWLDRRRIVRRKRVSTHTDRLCTLNKFVLEHAVAHVQQQVQTGLRARDLMRQVGQLAVKCGHERVAACLIVAVGIAFPIALANSEAFREQILQLVLSINPETGMAHVGMEPAKEEQTANVPRMDVPDGWEGLFFPTFLPDSLPLVHCETTRGDQVHSEAYYADETRSLRFEEQDNLDGWNVRAADARVLTIYLHSVPGYLIDRQTEDTHEVSIIWAEGKRMLRVTSIGLPADEAVLVAQSVKKIFAE